MVAEVLEGDEELLCVDLHGRQSDADVLPVLLHDVPQVHAAASSTVLYRIFWESIVLDTEEEYQVIL